MPYQLMNKDEIVAVYEERRSVGEYTYHETECARGRLPQGFITIDDWIDGRRIARHRGPLGKTMREYGMGTRHGFIAMTYCLSLTDTFWMKRSDDEAAWESVSLYRRPFDGVTARIAFDGTGMYGRPTSPLSPEFATPGSFGKCWVREGDDISLIKRGSGGFGADEGLEPHSEKLASDILEAAHIDHASYTIMSYFEETVSKCPLFTSENTGFVAAHRFFDRPFSAHDMLEFATSHGAGEEFREMVVMDAIIANTDRHAGNYGFLVDNMTGEIERFAPLFDHNKAFLPTMKRSEGLDEHLTLVGPKIGDDFIEAARDVATPSIREKIAALKDFEYQDPGFHFPPWKLEMANRLKNRQIDAILKS